MEEMTSNLNVQLKLLTFTQGKTKGIVEKANSEGIEQHREALRAIVKIVKHKNADWTSEIEEWRSSWQASWMERRSWGTTSNGWRGNHVFIGKTHSNQLQRKPASEEMRRRAGQARSAVWACTARAEAGIWEEDGRREEKSSCGVACPSEKHLIVKAGHQ